MRDIRSASLDQHSRIPLTVVSGGPGAGRSSLVRHLLARTSGVAAVVSDDIAIDPSLVARRDGATVRLRNGSRYIVADDDGATELAALSEQPDRPDHVVLDGARGRRARRLSGYGYMPGYRLDGTILVADAPAVLACATEGTNALLFEQDAGAADVIVLNKLDLVDTAQLDIIHGFLELVAPATFTLGCRHARVAPALILGAAVEPDARAVVAEWTSTCITGRARRRCPTDDAEQCRTWCLMRDGPVGGGEFRAWVRHLPPTILSGRGQVYISEEPQHCHYFHMMGTRWSLVRGPLWHGADRSTRVRLAGMIARRRPAARPAMAQTAADAAFPSELA